MAYASCKTSDLMIDGAGNEPDITRIERATNRVNRMRIRLRCDTHQSQVLAMKRPLQFSMQLPPCPFQMAGYRAAMPFELTGQSRIFSSDNNLCGEQQPSNIPKH